MPDIARWNGMDQLSEKFHNASPYAYVMNNPAMFLDPDGRDRKPASGSWLQDMWNNTTSYSTWSSTGDGGFLGGEVLGGMSHENFTNFYNFLAGGGTGNYTYWTGGAIPNAGYSLGSDGTRQRDMQEMVGHNINIKGNSQSSTDSFLNSVSTATTYTALGTGSTLGLANDFSESLISNGKMIKTANVFKTYNLYRVNGALNGNQYISGSKFLSRVGTIGKYAKYLPIVSLAGIVVGGIQTIQERHPGYLVRSILSAGVSFVPYSGPVAAWEIDQTNVDNFNAWTLSQ